MRDFPDIKLGISIPGRGETSELLNADGDENDYDWCVVFSVFYKFYLVKLCLCCMIKFYDFKSNCLQLCFFHINSGPFCLVNNSFFFFAKVENYMCILLY